MDEPFLGEVVHSTGHLTAEGEESVGQITPHCFNRTGGGRKRGVWGKEGERDERGGKESVFDEERNCYLD